MTAFQLVGLDAALFSPLFDLSDAELAAHGAVRRTADESPGFPCRISLRDADAGEQLLLLPFEHQPERSPYRASGPIFVRRGAVRAALRPGELPPYVTSRLMSVRGYDREHMIVAAAVCDGVALGAEIQRQFADPAVAYLHLHNARRGCFSCRVDRVA